MSGLTERERYLLASTLARLSSATALSAACVLEENGTGDPEALMSLEICYKLLWSSRHLLEKLGIKIEAAPVAPQPPGSRTG